MGNTPLLRMVQKFRRNWHLFFWWLSFFLSLHHVMMVAVVAGFYVPSNAIVKIKRRIVSSSMIVFLRYERNSLFPINVGEDHCSWIHIPERGREETNDAKTNGVQSILKLLKDQFDDTSSASPSPSTADWTKMRRFLYRVSSHNDHQTARDRGLSIYKVRKVLKFLEEVIPDRLLRRSIVLRAPRILTRNVNTRLRPTVEFLQSLYDDSLFLTAITRNPNLLLTSGTGYKGDDDLNLVETFLRTDLGLSQNCINKLKRSDPQLFQLSMVQLLSVVSFLRHILEKRNVDEASKVGTPCSSTTATATTKIIAKLIVTHPMIFQLSVNENLVPRMRYLQERCHLVDKDLAALLKSSCGAILGLSIKDNIEPTIDLLSNMLSNNELRKVLLSHAQILGLSLNNLRSKIAYFDAIDRMSPSNHAHTRKPSLASRILQKAPAAYSLSLTGNIIPTVKFLANIWGKPYLNNDVNVLDETTYESQSPEQHQNASSLASLLGECPSILTVSLDGNIKPTVEFYTRTGYVSLDNNGILQANSDGKVIIIRGRYITASLFHRLLPRWHYHVKEQKDKKHEPLINPPLYVLAGTTDAEFCTKLGYNISDYIDFKDESSPRLKFRSQFDTWIHTGRPIDT